MTKEAILTKLRKMEEQKVALLELAASLDETTLTAKSGEDKWSVLDVIEHMVLAEYHVFQGWPETTQMKAGKRTLMGIMFYYMVLFILRYHIPVQVLDKDMVPSGKHTLQELTAMWDKSHNWLRSYLTQLDQNGLRRAVFTHPASGPMIPKQMIKMMEAHMNRHIDKIDKLLK